MDFGLGRKGGVLIVVAIVVLLLLSLLSGTAIAEDTAIAENNALAKSTEERMIIAHTRVTPFGQMPGTVFLHYSTSAIRL